MPIITINGTIGSGTFEVGQMVANSLNLNYVDRMVLAEAARRVGSPVGVLLEKEQRVIRFRERLGRFLQTMLERSAISGVSGEPYFGRGVEMLPAETYTELAGDASSSAQQVNDAAFIDATTSVIKEVASAGNVVIIGRGSNMILADTPGVINVALVAPDGIPGRHHHAPRAPRPGRSPGLSRPVGGSPPHLLPQVFPRSKPPTPTCTIW